MFFSYWIGLAKPELGVGNRNFEVLSLKVKVGE